ncbi:MAG: tRNA lysidine(34) synthetase TilS [Bacteroidales bacterium]|nr:tRNA lysidine(34) synthetase TilS [Bacteroidales bacterium]
MLDRFTQYIAEQHLVPPGGKVLLAVSGGRDSVCMAHLFHRAHIPFAIAHCNFNLRPGDCDRDQEFVRRLAEHYGAEFFTTSFDTRAVAASTGESIEEAARRLRYQYFAQLLKQSNNQTIEQWVVATAHHRDDSIETFFLNLFRGTGISGLHGIRPLSTQTIRQSGNQAITVIRPLLCFSRSEIDDYIRRHQLSYVEDCTNLSLEHRRNRIRLQLMPLLRELYPSIDTTMAANIERFAQVEEIYDRTVAEMTARVGHMEQSPFGFKYHWYHISELLSLSPCDTLLFELLRPYGFSSTAVGDIISALSSAQTGARFLSQTHIALIDRDRLIVARYPLPASEPKIEISPVPLTDVSREHVEHIDADLVRQPLTLRPWRPGDRFCPLGMPHQRRLSDFLKDCKISLLEKQRVYVLVDDLGRIVWVVGLRIDHRFRITDNTRRCLRLVVSDWGTC